MLRARLAPLTAIGEGELRAFAVSGLTWPVLAGLVEGELIAIAGVCPHEDVSLADGELVGIRLTCPGHGYQFDIRTGRCRHDPDLILRRYPATIVDGEVWIELIKPPG